MRTIVLAATAAAVAGLLTGAVAGIAATGDPSSAFAAEHTSLAAAHTDMDAAHTRMGTMRESMGEMRGSMGDMDAMHESMRDQMPAEMVEACDAMHAQMPAADGGARAEGDHGAHHRTG